jgi:integrase
MPRGKKGTASLFRPSARHATIWVRYSGPPTVTNPRGRYAENTGIEWTEDQTSKAWKNAEKIRKQKEREYANASDPAVGIPQVINIKRTVRAWADLHLADLEAKTGAAWALRARYHVAHVCERTGIGALTAERVTAEKIEAHQRARLEDGVSAGTIKEEVTQLLAVLKRAQRARALGALPYVQHVKRKAQKTPPKPRVYLPWPKIADVIEALRLTFPAFADFTEAFALCALRPRALGRVTVGMIDLALGRVVVPAALMKEDSGDTPRDHEIPLVGEFGAVVARRLKDQASSGLLFHDGDGGSLLGSDTKLGLSERAQVAWRAAAPRFTFYSLRGCCSTRAEQGGATDVQVSALLSHSRGQNSTYSLASSVGAAMIAAEKHAKAETQRRGLVAVPPRVDEEAEAV